jgi:hypothetical protein
MKTFNFLRHACNPSFRLFFVPFFFAGMIQAPNNSDQNPAEAMRGFCVIHHPTTVSLDPAAVF